MNLETELLPGCIEEATMGTEEDEILVGGYEKNIEKLVVKAFKDIYYSQLEIDRYACFLVAPFIALSNFTGKKVTYDVIRGAFNALIKDGKFTKNFGGKMSDGVAYALRFFNEAHNLNIKSHLIILDSKGIIQALKEKSPVVTGIKYGKEYFKNEQDDGIIQRTDGTFGNWGHCIGIIKANTLDETLGTQIKFVENYDGVNKFNIIYTQFEACRELFFNTGYKFSL